MAEKGHIVAASLQAAHLSEQKTAQNVWKHRSERKRKTSEHLRIGDDPVTMQTVVRAELDRVGSCVGNVQSLHGKIDCQRRRPEDLVDGESSTTRAVQQCRLHARRTPAVAPEHTSNSAHQRHEVIILFISDKFAHMTVQPVVKVVMWSRGLTWRSQFGANPIPIPHPTNLMLFGHTITLYQFNQGAHTRAG